MRDKLLDALREAARQSAPRLPTMAEVAARAGVSAAEVQAHLGPAENFSALLSFQGVTADTRARIIASAARVFARKGFQRASLDEVAADAGLTKGAIYWHFKSKNDLLFALLDARFHQDTAPLLGGLRLLLDRGGDAQTALAAMFQAGIARSTSDPEWPRLYLECLNLSRDEEVRTRLSAFYDQIWAMSSDITRQLQAAGLTSAENDPQVMAVFWSALFDGLVLAWLIKGEALDFERVLPAIFRMLWRGIAPAPDSAPEIPHDD